MSSIKGNLGDALFADVFKRADKNDDARIDLGEFVEFFGDAHSSASELAALFAAADTDKSANIDHKELIAFFGASAAGRTFTPIFATLERLHAELNAALVASHAANAALGDAVSGAPAKAELFKERFFLREIAAQLDTLQRTADMGLAGVSALTPIAADAAERGRFNPSDHQSGANSGSISASSASADAVAAELAVPLHKQVDRLAKLIGRLEKSRATFNVPEEEIGIAHDTEAYAIVARHFVAIDAAAHVAAIKAYVVAARRQSACRHVSVRVVRGASAADLGEVFLHEIWEENDEHADWEASPEYKALTTALAAQSKSVSTEKMHLPASWFVYN